MSPAAANPFVGLRPFGSDEGLLFFGRHEQTVELLERLHRHPFNGVVGSSGCGKSSLVRAGLIPKLRAGMLVEDRARWLIAAMKPGGQPRRNLVRELLDVLPREHRSCDQETLDETLATSGLSALRQLLEPTLADANLLLLVDQFEEIFRFGTRAGRDEAADFVSLMLALAEQQALPIYVVMTMRSDFLGECDAFRGLPEALNRSQYLVPRLTRRQRREAIEGPVRLYHGQLACRLVDRLLNDAGEESDQLPVLQHALMRLWQRVQEDGGGELDLGHYEAVGTLDGALSGHAEEALSGMDGGELKLAEAVFRALTLTDPNNRRIRRPAALGQIVAETGSERAEIVAILEAFRGHGRSFLMPPEEVPLRDDTVIDISHESLIRQWRRLRGWVDAEAAAAAQYKRLADTTRRYAKGEAALLVERELEVALRWRETQAPTEAWAQRYGAGFREAMDFLAQSRRAHERKLAAEEARRGELASAREREREALRQKVILSERQVRQSRRIAVLTALILGIIAMLGGLALWQWREAEQQTTTVILERLTQAKPGFALTDLQRLVTEPRPGADEIARRQRLEQREDLVELFELGPGELPEGKRGLVVLMAVEHVLPLLDKRLDDPSLLAAISWTLDRFPGRETRLAERAQMLRDQALEPLRRSRPPPPEPGADDRDWAQIPGGRFVMGSQDDDEEADEDERPAHEVKISSFRMLVHEVTNGEYRRLVPNQDEHLPADLPAVNVNWYQAYAYCAWLGGRLPTEAEWEYAARAGTETRYWSGDTEEEMARVGWYNRNSEGALHPVEQLDPNPWGLYDVHGNAYEWVADGYGPFESTPQVDPAGPAAGVTRVIRGGGFDYEPRFLRSAFRFRVVPEGQGKDVGFRCARRPGRQP